MNSQQQCPSASLYDLVTKHWPQAVASSQVVSSSGAGSGASEQLMAHLVELRNSVVEPNAAWFRNHSFTGAVVFPLGNELVSPMVTVTQQPSPSGSGTAQSGMAEPAATSASSSTSTTTNNGGRLRRRFPQPQGQIPGGGTGTGTGTGTGNGNGNGNGSGGTPATPTTTVQARVPRQFVYIYHSEVIGVQYAQPNPSSPPNTLVAKVSNPAFLETSHPCNKVTSPWQSFKQSLPGDLAGSLVGCTTSSTNPAVSCFVLNVKPAPDCSIPGNCYGEPASVKSIMQVMARASAGMPTLGSAAPSDDTTSSTRLPVYVWIAIAAGTLALVAGAAFFLIRRKHASTRGRRASNSNSAYAKLMAANAPSSSPALAASSHMLSPPAATAQPPSTSSLDRQPPPLVVPAARRPASHLLTPPSSNTNLILTTQTFATNASASSPVLVADTLLHADTTPVPLPAHLATACIHLLTSSSLTHVPSRAFVGLSGDLAAHLSLQDLVDGWVGVLDLARAVARAKGVPLEHVGQWVTESIEGLARIAPADARVSPRGMVDWYAKLASETKDVGLAAGGKCADPAFVTDIVIPALGGQDATDGDRVKVATAAIVAFVRVKSMRPFAVLSEAKVGERVDAKVVKVAEELARASLARRGAARAAEVVRERVFPGVVDVVDGVVLAHARVNV